MPASQLIASDTGAALAHPGSVRARPAASPTSRSHLAGRRAAMLLFSYYPMDPRPRRAAEALAAEGLGVDVVCLRQAGEARRERVNGVEVLRVRLERRRGGVLGYVRQYSAFIAACAAILAVRSLRRRYALVYVNNMPDVLVSSALLPKLLGAKVILDLHDPMPELMTAIFGFSRDSLAVRALRRAERWSIRRADAVLTVNLACKKLFSLRSCPADKIEVVMNSPDEAIFGFRSPTAGGQGATARPLVIMYHGSLVERNGLDLAVDALARVRGAFPRAELRVYGASTPFLERVMQSAHARGLGDAVRYLGAQRAEAIAEAIAGCDVGIIPNHRNVFTALNTPTRIFEYLARGKPVIAPRAPGIEDYFDDGSLLFFELGNAEDLARALARVLERPDDVVDVVRRGQEVYLAHAWREEKLALLDLVARMLR